MIDTIRKEIGKEIDLEMKKIDTTNQISMKGKKEEIEVEAEAVIERIREIKRGNIQDPFQDLDLNRYLISF